MNSACQPAWTNRAASVPSVSLWLTLFLFALCALPSNSHAQDPKVPEGDYYKIITFPLPDDVILECGGLEPLPDGKMHPFASGIRSPAGMAVNEKGELFFTDNQGPWNGAGGLKLLKKGAFEGNPEGNKWYDLPLVKEELGKRPVDPIDKSRIYK